MRLTRFTTSLLAAMLSAALALPLLVRAEDNTPAPAAKAPAADADASPVDKRQERLRKRYQKFEQALLVLAQYMQKTDPAKARLIKEALTKSQGERIETRMENIVALLKSESFGDAADAQTELLKSLHGIFDILQRENQLEANRREQERIKGLLKDLGRLINQERKLRFQTERGEGDPLRLADIQKQIAEKTRELRDKIDRQDATRNGQQSQGSKSKSQGSKSQGSKSQGSKSQGSKSQGSKSKSQGSKSQGSKSKSQGSKSKSQGSKSKSQGSKSKSQGSKSKSQGSKSKSQGSKSKSQGSKSQGSKSQGSKSQGSKSQGSKSQGSKSQGSKSQGSKSQNNNQNNQNQNNQSQNNTPRKTPGRDDIEQARKAMERAIEELKKARRDGGSEAEAEAERNLRKAQAKLEEILKQLREEERELLLRDLQARFAMMLRIQKEVYAGTRRVASTPKSAWTAFESEAVRNLAKKEDEISLEAQKALALLKAEGSSIAFPEAVKEVHEDMVTVTGWLVKENVGKETQAVERDIIDALSEMIEALKKEIEKLDKKKKKQPKPKNGKPQDPALVDKLAELKMLRTLQMRINRRTRRMGNRIIGGQATEKNADVVKQLKDLARRQARIQQAAYDLATGRNQ